MTTVLITGAGGQLGAELVRAEWPEAISIVAHTSSELDITDSSAVADATKAIDPDVIVNAAAYTAVDAAEDEERKATAVNGVAVGDLAEAANRVNAMLVHLSSDYVFDGRKRGWYTEADSCNPLGAYGRSKMLGEELAAKADRSVVLRTAWVYGALGQNFVRTMLRLAQERDEIGVVHDQIGCPTSARDLAGAVRSLIERTGGGRDAPEEPLYHLASPTPATWHEFAMAVFANSSSGFAGACRPLTTAEYPTKAARPQNSRLSSEQIQSSLGIELPPWQESLPGVVTELEGRR